MAAFMKGNIYKIKKMDLELLLGLMVGNTEEIGRMVSNMEEVNIFYPMANPKLVSGFTERRLGGSI